MSEATDPDLLQDFLTEAGELIEQLDTDPVKLEDDPTSQPLLDQIFRSLHTIKGAASFLGMPPVTTFAHAAEDTLNKLRKGVIKVDQRVMDAMLKSVDALRGQLGELGQGQRPSDGPEELIRQLHEIASGIPASMRSAGVPVPGTPAATTTAPAAAAAPAAQSGTVVDLASLATISPLTLSPEKADMLSFMVSDLMDSARHIEPAAIQLRNAATRSAAAMRLSELAESMQPTADYYGFAFLNRLVSLIAAAGAALGFCSDSAAEEASVRLGALTVLISTYADGLTNGQQYTWPIDTFESRLGDVCCGQPLAEGVAHLHGDSTVGVLTLDGVIPLVDLRDTLGEPEENGSSGFAVVIGVGAERVGLVVDRLVGQSEVVTKPLDDGYTQGGPFSGATIREDGNVSLILDVVKLVRTTQPVRDSA